MSRTGTPHYKPALRPIGWIEKRVCNHCGKQIYMYIEAGIDDCPSVKDFCSWACSDAFDRRRR